MLSVDTILSRHPKIFAVYQVSEHTYEFHYENLMTLRIEVMRKLHGPGDTCMASVSVSHPAARFGDQAGPAQGIDV